MMHISQHGIKQINESRQTEEQLKKQKQQVNQQNRQMPMEQGNNDQHMSFLQQGN